MSDDLRLSRAAARRGCGLAVADVMQDANTGLWTIDVRTNKFRQLKRTWTARQLPIHEELYNSRAPGPEPDQFEIDAAPDRIISLIVFVL